MVWERRMADLLAAVAEFIIARKSMTVSIGVGV